MISAKRLPYPGLRAFTRDESDLFFGRDGCIDAMVNRLSATRFLAVLGSSGSGKSSLVRTGLLDALDLGLHPWAGSRWTVVDFHPGGHPLRNLSSALLNATQNRPSQSGEVDLLATFLRRGPRALVEWASSGSVEQGTNLLLLVDQFEELFRYGNYASQEEAEAFVSLLLETSIYQGVKIHIVVTMRSEFLGASALLAGLAEKINAGLYLTPRMTRDECREAIEGPAGVTGFTVEPALVNRLLNDLGSFAPWESEDNVDQAERLARRADQLPLMQHVLNRLWARADNESGETRAILKLSDYDGLGGLSGAIDAHGNEIFAALGPGRAGTIERLFRSLVSGTSVAAAVRRPCRFSELLEVAGDQEDVHAIVEAFSAPDCNFIRTSEQPLSPETIVDISHESLIRQWSPLRRWLENEAQDAAVWKRLTSSEERYAKGEGGLLTGLDLQNLATWWESAQPTPAWARKHGGQFEPVCVFLQTSRQTDEARVLAERERQVRGRNQLIGGVLALAALLLVVSTLGVLAQREAKSAQIEKARSATALEESTRDRQSLHTTNLQLELTKSHLDEALKVANAQTNRADAEKNKAENDALRLTDALDNVRGIINSDKYGHLIGVGNLQADLMQSIQRYRSDIESKHKSMVGGASKVRDAYLRALAMGATGDAEQERQLLRKAYDDGEREINNTPPGRFPSPALQSDFLDDCYIYIWFLLDIGETREAQEVLQGVEDAMSHHFSAPTTSPMFVAFGRIESLKDRISSDQKSRESGEPHARKALDFAKKAVALPEADSEASSFEIRAYLNLAIDAKGPEKKVLSDKACALAETWYEKNKLDERFIRTKVECIEYATIGPDENDRGKTTFTEAQQIVEGGLNLNPSNQALLLLMADTETSLAFYCEKLGQNEEGRRHRLSAKSNFVRALQGRTVFQAKPAQLKTIYSNLKLVEFTNSGDELQYYRDIIDALKKTLSAFPNALSFSYIAADASDQVGELLANDPAKALEAKSYLSQSRAWFDRKGLMTDVSKYSEDFSQYCGIYKTTIKEDGATHNYDLISQDMNTVMTKCKAVLDRYPWDIYLRYQIISSNAEAGRALYDGHRFKEALEYLNYASHWGSKDGTSLLAQMYREGLGVSKDEKKATDLESLAKGQILTRYTVPVDIDGVKVPFRFYIRDWPTEYPYDGIDDQTIWLKEARGGAFAPEVTDSFHKLVAIAKENKVSFRELVEYALSTSDAEKAFKQDESTFSAAHTPQNLVALKKSANAYFDELIKLKTPEKADKVERELIRDAEDLSRENPIAASYRVANAIYLDAGEHASPNDKTLAEKYFLRSEEFASLLPQNDEDDVYRRVVIDERLGDLYTETGKNDMARAWYTKEVENAHKRFDMNVSSAGLTTLRNATRRLYGADKKLRGSGRLVALDPVLMDSTEKLNAKDHSGAASEEIILSYIQAATLSAETNNTDRARAYLVHAEATAGRLTICNPDSARTRSRLFRSIGEAQLSTGSIKDAKTAFREASGSMESCLQPLAATMINPSKESRTTLASLYGSLSYTEILGGDFLKAKGSAEQGLKFDPDAAWIEGNLAEALLLLGQREEAMRHFTRIRKASVNSSSMTQATAEDFELLKKLGYGRPEMDDILKKMAEK